MNVVEIRIGSDPYLAFNPAHVKIEELDLEKVRQTIRDATSASETQRRDPRQPCFAPIAGRPSNGQSRTTSPPSARPRWRTRGWRIWRLRWDSPTFTVTRGTVNILSSSQTSGQCQTHCTASPLLLHPWCLAPLWAEAPNPTDYPRNYKIRALLYLHKTHCHSLCRSIQRFCHETCLLKDTVFLDLIWSLLLSAKAAFTRPRS